MRQQMVALLGLFGLALAGLGCGGSGKSSGNEPVTTINGRPPRAWVEDLKSADEMTRNGAENALTEYGGNMTGWHYQIAYGNAEDKQRATAELERHRPAAKEVLAELLPMLKDADAEKRVLAAMMIERFGPEAESTVPALIAGLNDPNPKALAFIITALGEVGAGAKETVPALLAFLKGKDDKGMKPEVIYALGRIGPRAKEAVPELIPLLKDQDQRLRKAAAEALQKIDPDAATKAGVK